MYYCIAIASWTYFRNWNRVQRSENRVEFVHVKEVESRSLTVTSIVWHELARRLWYLVVGRIIRSRNKMFWFHRGVLSYLYILVIIRHGIK